MSDSKHELYRLREQNIIIVYLKIKIKLKLNQTISERGVLS